MEVDCRERAARPELCRRPWSDRLRVSIGLMMNENFKWIAAAVAVVGLSIGAVVYFTRGGTPEKPPAPAPVAEKPAEPEEPPVEHPLAEADSNQALPSLNDSDLPMQMEVEDLIGREAVGKYLVSTEMIRHFVVTLDNL